MNNCNFCGSSKSLWCDAEVKQLKTDRVYFKELAELRGKLLVCYRVGKQPSGKLLDRLHLLNKQSNNQTSDNRK